MTIGSFFNKIGRSVHHVEHKIKSGYHDHIVEPIHKSNQTIKRGYHNHIVDPIHHVLAPIGRAQHHTTTVVHHTVVEPTEQKVLNPVDRTIHQHVITPAHKVEHTIVKHLDPILGNDADLINNEVVQRFLTDLNPDLGHAFDQYDLKDIVNKVATEAGKEIPDYINPKEMWNDLTKDLETIYFEPTNTDALIGSNGTTNTGALTAGILDDNPSLRIEPVLNIKKGATFEIRPDFKGDGGNLNIMTATYTNGQTLDINFDINLPVTLGIEATLTTKGEGAYKFPVAYSYNGGEEEDEDGKKTGANRWEVQFSDGVFSFAAGINVGGELLVGEKAANSTYKIGATLDTDIIIKDTYELSFTENFSPEKALQVRDFEGKPEDFLSYLYNNKMVKIEQSDVLDGKKFDVSDIPLDEIFKETELNLIKENETHPSFGFDDLGLGVYIEPEVTFSVGLVLEEGNVGLNVGSIGTTAGLKLEYEAKDISGIPSSKLVTSLNGSITTDIMELNAGPVSLPAYELPVWADSVVLSTVTL